MSDPPISTYSPNHTEFEFVIEAKNFPGRNGNAKHQKLSETGQKSNIITAWVERHFPTSKGICTFVQKVPTDGMRTFLQKHELEDVRGKISGIISYMAFIQKELTS
jgi:hypothetical protein